MLTHSLAFVTAFIAYAPRAMAQLDIPAPPPPRSAPEIDGTLTGAAVALVLGGLFIFTTLRRRKHSRS